MENKFKKLRVDFTRHLREMKSLPSGSGREAAAKMQKYDCLQWLLPYIEHRNTTSNSSHGESAENSNFHTTMTSASSQSPTTSNNT